MRQELALIAALVSLVISIMSNLTYQTNTKSPTRPLKVVGNAILSPLIMIAFLCFFKFKFVILNVNTVAEAVYFGILCGVVSVAAVSNTMAMLPSILKLLIAKWLGIDAKNIQTPNETNQTKEFQPPSEPRKVIEVIKESETKEEVKKE